MTDIGWALIMAAATAMAFYLGNVLGCLVLCDTIPGLKPAAAHAWKIPFLAIMDAWRGLRNGGIGGLIAYLRLPCKDLRLLESYLDD